MSSKKQPYYIQNQSLSSGPQREETYPRIKSPVCPQRQITLPQLLGLLPLLYVTFHEGLWHVYDTPLELLEKVFSCFLEERDGALRWKHDGNIWDQAFLWVREVNIVVAQVGPRGWRMVGLLLGVKERRYSLFFEVVEHVVVVSDYLRVCFEDAELQTE